MLHTFIPSPENAIWYLGPVPIRAYALAIIAGALIAIWIAEKRFTARGGRAGAVSDAAMWAVPFGIIGGRIYHVITDWQLYFGEGRDPWSALKIWEGGLGIWGAVVLGGIGVWIASRVHGFDFIKMGDALAPGILVAQGIGRLGNWFNQELFGRPTTLPWGLEIDLANRPIGYEAFETFHPTFLYELVWNLLAAAAIIAVDRRVKLTHLRAFAMYMMVYSVGRLMTESLRIDPVNHLGPFRFNVWTTIVVFLMGLALFLWGRRRALAEASTNSSTESGNPDPSPTDESQS